MQYQLKSPHWMSLYNTGKTIKLLWFRKVSKISRTNSILCCFFLKNDYMFCLNNNSIWFPIYFQISNIQFKFCDALKIFLSSHFGCCWCWSCCYFSVRFDFLFLFSQLDSLQPFGNHPKSRNETARAHSLLQQRENWMNMNRHIDKSNNI